MLYFQFYIIFRFVQFLLLDNISRAFQIRLIQFLPVWSWPGKIWSQMFWSATNIGWDDIRSKPVEVPVSICNLKKLKIKFIFKCEKPDKGEQEVLIWFRIAIPVIEADGWKSIERRCSIFCQNPWGVPCFFGKISRGVVYHHPQGTISKILFIKCKNPE